MARSKVRIMNAEVVDGGTIDLDQEDVRLADGTRLTEGRADEFAEEVRRGVGRPSLSAPGRRSPQLRLAIPNRLATSSRHAPPLNIEVSRKSLAKL